MTHGRERDRSRDNLRLSLKNSAGIANCLTQWMLAANVKSTYELSLIVGIPRSTLQRWLTGRVRIPEQGAEELINGLGEHAQTTVEAREALSALLHAAEPTETQDHLLRSAFRTRGVRIKSAMAAIRAAGLQLVPDPELHSS